jgi:hypothetical protein
MHSLANLEDGYNPGHSELVHLEFSLRERSRLVQVGATKMVERLFATALSGKIARIGEPDRYWKRNGGCA